MPKLTIDNREVEAREGSTILEAAKEVGIEIPTFCYNEGVSAYGACRLCSVEIVKRGKSRVVASCLYPVEEGLVVRTNTERIMNIRKMIAELLLARCPNVKIVKDLARQMGVTKPRFKLEDNECTLCGLCVRACQEVVGVSAISFINRGTEREVETPFCIESDKCIGCGACVFVCPTGAIKLEDIGRVREIKKWHASQELQKCKICGRYFAPKVQLDFVAGKSGVPRETFEVCETCRQMKK